MLQLVSRVGCHNSVCQTAGAGGAAGKTREHDRTAATAPRTACSGTATKAGETVWLPVEEQQQQEKLLMKQQCKAKKQMRALKDDLKQTKNAMERRFQATEASLEGLHRELTDQLQAGQGSLRKELQEELRPELWELWNSKEEWRAQGRYRTFCSLATISS